MKMKIVILTTVIAFLFVVAVVLAAPTIYDLSWWTVDSGGSTFSTGGSYAVGSTTGQPDPGSLTGGDYVLGGGFWGGGAVKTQSQFYLPVISR